MYAPHPTSNVKFYVALVQHQNQEIGMWCISFNWITDLVQFSLFLKLAFVCVCSL